MRRVTRGNGGGGRDKDCRAVNAPGAESRNHFWGPDGGGSSFSEGNRKGREKRSKQPMCCCSLLWPEYNNKRTSKRGGEGGGALGRVGTVVGGRGEEEGGAQYALG